MTIGDGDRATAHMSARMSTQHGVRTRRQVLGDRHPDTLASIGNLASLLTSQRKLAAAEPLYGDPIGIAATACLARVSIEIEALALFRIVSTESFATRVRGAHALAQ